MSLDHVTPWGYSDTNYVEDPRDCNSMSGSIFMHAGGPVAWKSKKQASVVLSTTEAEYYAVGIDCQEAMWIKQICQELNVSIDKPIQIYTDNTGAVALTNNPIFHNHLKHIDIHWHFVRDLICTKTICTSQGSHITEWHRFPYQGAQPL